MKNLLRIALIGLFSFCMSACDKDDRVLQPETYIVNGIQDLQFVRYGNSGPVAYAALALTVEYKVSVQEYVTLSLDSVPKGMGYSFSPAAGYATFSTGLSITDTATAPGTYTLKLTSTGDHSAPRVFYFKVTVPEVPTCVDGLAGAYTSYSACASGSGSFGQTLTRKAGRSNVLIMSNFLNSGAPVELTVNCANNTATIATQNFSTGGRTYQVAGSGNFSPASGSIGLTLSMKDLTLNTTISCYLTMIK